MQDAVGLVLAHDVTEIIPQKKKDVAFKRGRIIERERRGTSSELGKKLRIRGGGRRKRGT